MTAVYVLTGGLKAVIYVDGVQTVIMMIGGFILMITGLNEVGGWDKLFEDYPCSAPNVTVGPLECAFPPETYDNIIRPADDTNFPWPGVVFGRARNSEKFSKMSKGVAFFTISSLTKGMIIGSIWYWCTDQMIVQITLSAKDLSNAKLGCVVAACLKIFPVFLMVLPGMISRTLWPSDIGTLYNLYSKLHHLLEYKVIWRNKACQTAEECLRACGSENGCTNVAYPTLVMRILPSGLKLGVSTS